MSTEYPGTALHGSVDRTGYAILNLLKEDHAQAEIVSALTERFEVEEEIASRELQNFVFHIKDLG